jgi:catechol 2,3-dioxygenase-like lactoylglutathione lyase family enzyme
MDNVLLVVEDLEAAIAFFEALGMTMQGRAPVEGPAVDRVIGVDGTRAEIVMMQTPDGQGRIELDKFHAPATVHPQPDPMPVNALGYRRVMFAVDDLDAVLDRLRATGAELVGDVMPYGDTYRLAYVRGPDGVLIGLAQSLA